MHSVIRTSPRLVRISAVALGLAALLASVLLLAHPVGGASAATVTGPSVTLVHGCDTGDGDGDWVEATLWPSAQTVSSSSPTIYQLGLSTSSADAGDAYTNDSGPILVSFTGVKQTVRLSGPTHNAHLFLRAYGQTAHRDWTVPNACQHVAKTDFDLAAPQIARISPTANCLSQDANLTVTVFNEGDKPANYTLLLVLPNGQITGSNRQGQLVSVPAGERRQIEIGQPYKSISTTYDFTVRALGQDGTGATTGSRAVQCDSRGHQGPPPTAPSSIPVRPTRPAGSSAPAPSGSASSSSGPSARPSAPATKSAGRSTTSAPTAAVASRSSVVAGAPANNAPAAGGSELTSAGGGPVLGDADSTRQPAKPSAKPTSSKSTTQSIEESPLARGITSPMGAVGLSILLGLGVAVGAMVSVSRANARRR